MDPNLRQHSCRIGINYDKKLILVAPEEGNDHVVLTTPALYAWHAHQISTEEGIREWIFIESGGFMGKDLTLKILNDFRILFVDCSEIFVYGVILSEKRNQPIFAFNKKSTNVIQGSPFLYRKSVFVSHSSKDKPIVRDLISRIERKFDVWIDEKKIIAGDSITNQINKGLTNSDAILLCLSQNSISSKWVQKEYSFALHKGLRLIPIKLDNCIVPPILMDIKYLSFYENETDCVEEIIKSVELA